jgi:hypothetical protein
MYDIVPYDPHISCYRVAYDLTVHGAAVFPKAMT